MLGRTRKQLGILDIFEEHNRKVEALVGLDYALVDFKPISDYLRPYKVLYPLEVSSW